MSLYLVGSQLAGASGSLFSTAGGSGFAPNYSAVSGGTMTSIFDRQWNTTDSNLGTLPPTGLSGTDQYGMTWSPQSAPGFTSGVAPLIATPASLTTTIGATVPALPDANSTCLAISYPSGYPAGYVPFVISTGPSGGTCKRMYAACWALMPSNFLSNGNNIKWFNYQNTAPVSNHIAMHNSFDNTSDGRSSWMVLQANWGGSGSYGGQGSNASGAINALSIPPPQLTGPGWWPSYYGTWVCLEWYLQTESNPGVSSDGIFKGFFAGTLINYWNNIRFNAASGDSNGFNLYAFIPYWGGGGSAAAAQRYLCVGRMMAAQGS